MPDTATQHQEISRIAAHVAALDAIDRRQDEILAQLDELNDRILRTLAEAGAAPPKLPPVFRTDKKAA